MKSVGRLVALLMLCTVAWAEERDTGTLSKLNAEERTRLLEDLQCPAPVWNRLSRLKAGVNADISPPVETTMCALATDAFCTSTPHHAVCRERRPTGAYAGYYLMRYAMPVVAMLREALRASGPGVDEDVVNAGFDSVVRLLDLMSPSLRGCRNMPGVRTWCTPVGKWYQAVPSHQAAVAYLAAESLRLLAECRARGTACPKSGDRLDPMLARWFDVLLWDHALLEGTLLRNSLTQHVRTQTSAALRLRQLRDSFDASAINTPAFRFATDGWWIAIAANLLAVDRLLSGEGDPRAVALNAHQHAALQSLVAFGTDVLEQRGEPTRLRDFEGNEAQGLQFDSKLWDRHEYRRFSAVSEGPRPFSVINGTSGDAPTVVYAGAEEMRARNVGLDSGHYRRLTWLYYTLSDVENSIETDWVDDEALEGLANQFAYAVHWHPCHHLRTNGCVSANDAADAEAVPRFVNYASGQNGWYRLTPARPCDAGVPPYGFSTLMVISENLWWARFNDDVARIWARLESAVNDSDRPAPSRGDSAPCGENKGKSEWNRSYRQMVLAPDGRLTSHGLGFYAMKYWSELALQRP
jgi:hypothetical protein